MRKFAIRSGLAGLFLLFVIQFIPFSLTNPPITLVVAWDSPRTENLFRRACADCHSHETTWPWYSRVAPISWYTQKHVIDARKEFNISIPDHVDPEEAGHQIKKGEMPLFSYTLLHPEARLTDVEKKELIEGLEKTFNPPIK